MLNINENLPVIFWCLYVSVLNRAKLICSVSKMPCKSFHFHNVLSKLKNICNALMFPYNFDEKDIVLWSEDVKNSVGRKC